MVVDTSALVAMVFGEPERQVFVDAISQADDPIISAGTFLEAAIVTSRRTGGAGPTLRDVMAALGVRCVAFDEHQATLAMEAFQRFGKGRSPAGLNFGDCFSYALAVSTGRPLLFKGRDFAATDVVPALPAS